MLVYNIVLVVISTSLRSQNKNEATYKEGVGGRIEVEGGK